MKRRLAAAPPEQIADGVWLLRGGITRSMNVYLLEGDGGVTVYDAGEKGMADAILAAVLEAEGSGGRSYWRLGELPLGVRLLHRFLHHHVWDGGPVTISGTVREGDEAAGFEVVEFAGHAPTRSPAPRSSAPRTAEVGKRCA